MNYHTLLASTPLSNSVQSRHWAYSAVLSIEVLREQDRLAQAEQAALAN